MPGPVKNPARLHKRKGNFRPSRHEGVEPKVEKPIKPKGMSRRADMLWKYLTDLLKGHGLLTKLDRTALQLLCDSFELYSGAMDEIESTGLMVEEGTEKSGFRTVPNPAIKVRDTAWGQIHKMCREFGLTPSARCGLKSSSNADTQDFLGDVLGIQLN